MDDYDPFSVNAPLKHSPFSSNVSISGEFNLRYITVHNLFIGDSISFVMYRSRY